VRFCQVGFINTIFFKIKQEKTVSSASIINYFPTLPDPRTHQKNWRNLNDIITIATCGVICGADSWSDIAAYGKTKQDWLSTFLELPEGIPSHDTFNRVFLLINSMEFQRCFSERTQSAVQLTGGRVVAIDGKGSYDTVSGEAAIHMVSARASANHLLLGQIKTEEKSNEIKAIPELLKILDIKGCMVTVDAMGCQKRRC